MRRLSGFLVGIVFAALLAIDLPAQSIYGTLTGIVSDSTGAVLPKATLKLRDENSGSLRDSVTNSEGYFTFVSLPPGTYQLVIESAGFETYKQSHIDVRGGDKMNVNVTMKVGSAAT
ncbi:MAG TPA: carboxypeptidase-like regulatory domain-containing protein [Bryobacteraceae bacterium]